MKNKEFKNKPKEENPDKPKKEKKVKLFDEAGNELHDPSPILTETAHLATRVQEQEEGDRVFVKETRTYHEWNGINWNDTGEGDPGSLIP